MSKLGYATLITSILFESFRIYNCLNEHLSVPVNHKAALQMNGGGGPYPTQRPPGNEVVGRLMIFFILWQIFIRYF